MKVTCEQFKIVQEVLFRNGYYWYGGDNSVRDYKDVTYVVFKNSQLMWNTELGDFNFEDGNELTFQEFIEKYGEHQPQSIGNVEIKSNKMKYYKFIGEDCILFKKNFIYSDAYTSVISNSVISYYVESNPELWIEVETNEVSNINTKPYYSGKRSLYKFAEEWGLNAWEFDAIKRIIRCRKKGSFKEDLEKTKDVIDIYLKEYEQE